MVYTRYGLTKLRAAEVRRGCIFAEDLSSVDGIIRNGGVIGTGAKFVSPTEGFRFSGAATSNILYGDMLRQNLTGITISFWVKYATPGFATLTSLVGQSVSGISRTEIFTNTGDLFFYVCVDGVGRYAQQSLTNVTDGNWHYITGTWVSGSYVHLYVDGILVASSVATYTGAITISDTVKDFAIGSWPNGGSPLDGNMKGMMVFNKALDADEILAYYNGSLFKYDDFCVCDLPFDIAHHDSVNSRALDISGYNNHATFGTPGSPASFPTKLAGRGYSFDGGDYMRTPIVPTERMSVYCLAYVVGPATNNYLFGSTAAGTTVRFFLYSATTTDVFGFGAGSGILSSSQKSTDGIIHGIVARHDSARNYIHCDGKQVLQSDLARTVANGVPMFIGAYSNNGAVSGTLLNGSKMFSLKIFDNIFLNQIQCLDLDIRAKDNCFRCP